MIKDIRDPDYPLHHFCTLLKTVKGRTFIGTNRNGIGKVIRIIEAAREIKYLDFNNLLTIKGSGSLDINIEYLEQTFKRVKNPHMAKGFDRLIITTLTGTEVSNEEKKLLLQFIITTDLLLLSLESPWYELLYRIAYILAESYPNSIDISDTLSVFRIYAMRDQMYL